MYSRSHRYHWQGNKLRKTSQSVGIVLIKLQIKLIFT